MKDNNIMNQISAIFGAFMVIFYIGVGLYLALAESLANIDPFLRKFVGFTFTLYGLYRGYVTVTKIREAFFRRDDINE